MKIYILPVPSVLQPESQPFVYPAHNDDYGIEQDFLQFLRQNSSYLVDSREQADWVYLPVYWTRWHLSHDYGKRGGDELKALLLDMLSDTHNTFAVCQYDDGPMIDLGDTVVFYGSRKTVDGHDAPLLCREHRLPWIKPTKKYKASFIGRIATHDMRVEMQEELKDMADVYIHDGDMGERKYVHTMLASYVSLAPRGYGGSSFRFYESMQLGVVPLLIGDIDTRPFKSAIDWDSCSLYAKNAKVAKKLLESRSENQLVAMGKAAKDIYQKYVTYGEWCKYLIEELEYIV